MLFLRTLLAAVVLVLGVFASLPSAAQCDTSYYEKYYSARRFFPPLKRISLVEYKFELHLENECLESFEQVALVGDHKELGAWSAQNAILLNRTDAHNVWTAAISLAPNSSVNYRYFIAAVDNETRAVQIRRWESYVIARSFNISTIAGSRVDTFGLIDGHCEVQRGWLDTSQIVQFKLFRDPFAFNESSSGNEQLLVKLQPIDPHTRTPILPSARANAEYVRMVYGDSFLRAQPEFGVPYERNDIVIFHTTLVELQSVAYLVKVYAKQQPSSDLVRLVGYQYVYADSLRGSEGSFLVDLISPVWLNVIGTLNLQYLVIKPMPHSSANFRTSFVDYWRANWTGLEAGHRGLGRSLKQSTNVAPIIENTVAAMKAAGNLGGDGVEFDVMLTHDLVPIIYHDYMIYVCMDPKTPTSKDDLTEVLIKDVTYEQLINLKTYQVIGTKIVEYPAHNTVSEEQADQRLFPLFEDFLTKVNKSVAFDIEIKWPQQTLTGGWESIQTIDKNTYIDRILDVMQKHGCGRLSFFTSFDADICSLIRFKQNMYPCMHILGVSGLSTYADPRTATIRDSINNAQAFDLSGIVPNALSVQLGTSNVQIATSQNKLIFLWGDTIKDTASIASYKAKGVTGLIYDRMDLWLPSGRQNFFEQEADLPEFFQLQCVPPPVVVGNATAESILSNVNLL